MSTEADFRKRVQGGAWPSDMRHGTTATGHYDYTTVVVLWSNGDTVTYEFEATPTRPLDGWRRRSALGVANEILSRRAHGCDVAK